MTLHTRGADHAAKMGFMREHALEAGGVEGQNVSEDPQKIQRTSFRYILPPQKKRYTQNAQDGQVYCGL